MSEYNRLLFQSELSGLLHQQWAEENLEGTLPAGQGHDFSYKHLHECRRVTGGVQIHKEKRTGEKELLPVIPQVVLSSEGLVANVTCVGSFISVGSFMDQKVVGLGEVPATEFTHELLLGFGW